MRRKAVYVEERRRNLLTIGGLAAVYFLAGKLGLSMAFVHPSSTAVWPPTGIALAAFLILGYRVWPGVFLGAFLVNVTTAGTHSDLARNCGRKHAGRTARRLSGNAICKRTECIRAGHRHFQVRDPGRTIEHDGGATFGVTSLSLGGFAHWADFKEIWLTWWLGDARGRVMVAPLLILWSANYRVQWSWTRLGEMLALIAGMFLIGEIVFCGLMFRAPRNYPLEYLCIPFLIWAAVRFGRREAALVTVLLSGIAIRGTLHRVRPVRHWHEKRIAICCCNRSWASWP